MASTYPGSQAMPQPSGMPAATMLGFGQSPAPPYYAPAPGPVDPSQQQRLQQYYSTGMYHQQQPQQLPPLSQATLNSASLKDPTSTRRSGKVKFFDTQKGFGFINDYRPEELGNEEVFVHYTSITAKSGFRSLAEGEEAEYDVVRGPKGFQAANVTGPGGQQVMGDNRGRNNKNAFIPMNPYPAMFPYVQQDPNSFYAAASPYTQPMLLLPQADFRGNPPHQQAPSPYRQPVGFPGHPAPYASPAPIRPYDIGKELAGISLGGLTIDDGTRGKPPQSNSAPFGGMFGALPGFDIPAGPVPPSNLHRSGTSPIASTSYRALASPSRPLASTQGPISARSSSLTDGNIPDASKLAASASPPQSANAERSKDDKPNLQRPPALHSRSSSLLYATKKNNSPPGNIS